MDAWTHLRAVLDELASSAPAPPRSGRRGAALALLRDPGDGDLELLLTRRHDDLAHHPGQISFPGGKVDAGESTEQAALREAHEECGLDPVTVTLLGRLPAFYIPPSRFWLQVVVGRWDAPHPLHPAEDEVAQILTVRFSELLDESRWRAVRLSARGDSWAWQLDDGHVLWGATAIVTAVLVGLVMPGWNSDTEPGDLMPDREIRPWERTEAGPPRPGPARIPDVAELPLDRVERLHVPGGDAEEAEAAGRIVAQVVQTMLEEPGGPVLVLCGFGLTGTVGAAAACALDERGVEVHVVVPGGDEPLHADTEALLKRMAERVTVHAGTLPEAALTIDALVGRGLQGALRGPLHDMVLALREHAMPVVSIDLPSGLHPTDGLVGDTVTADVTLAVGAPAGGLFGSGLGPFVGDLYLLPSGVSQEQDPIVRIVPGAGDDRWRE